MWASRVWERPDEPNQLFTRTEKHLQTLLASRKTVSNIRESKAPSWLIWSRCEALNINVYKIMYTPLNKKLWTFGQTIKIITFLSNNIFTKTNTCMSLLICIINRIQNANATLMHASNKCRYCKVFKSPNSYTRGILGEAK